MKKYIAHLTQASEGCHYSIACGHKVIDLGEHKDVQDAVSHCMAHLKEWGYHGVLSLSSCIIHEVAHTSIVDMDYFYKAKRIEARKIIEAKERAMLELLQAKYKTE